MSAAGQTQTSYRDLDVMSAVLLITDSTRTSFNVAEGPISDIAVVLFDHLVGGGEERPMAMPSVFAVFDDQNAFPIGVCTSVDRPDYRLAQSILCFTRQQINAPRLGVEVAGCRARRVDQLLSRKAIGKRRLALWLIWRGVFWPQPARVAAARRAVAAAGGAATRCGRRAATHGGGGGGAAACGGARRR